MNSSATKLIQSLLKPQAYPHGVKQLQLIETHISWVILTGDYVYKIKKPLDLGFLDFSSLDKRKHFCEEEIRLNQRLAPQLYLNTVAISGSVERPQFCGRGKVIEYAVRMRQFPQENMLDAVLQRGALTAEHFDQLARDIGLFHQQITQAPLDGELGSFEAIREPMLENFQQIRPLISDENLMRQLNRLQGTTSQNLAALHEVITARKQQGFIRECHGDMHLGNMALLDGRITVFDCIEFNPNLYWIDVISEVTFLVMDLIHRDQPDWAYRFINRYLEVTGDYQGLRLLPLYLMYRAMVRAKVSCIRMRQEELDIAEKEMLVTEFKDYLKRAEQFSKQPTPYMLITHGLSGSGKTHYALPLAEQLGAIHLRSDIERKRLFGLQAEQQSGSKIDSGIYSKHATQQTYDRVAELAGQVIDSGYPVIVDATFLNRGFREQFHALAQRKRVPFLILHFEATEDQLKQNILKRKRKGVDASEADLAVLARQLARYQPLGTDEQEITIIIRVAGHPEPRDVAKEILQTIKAIDNAYVQ